MLRVGVGKCRLGRNESDVGTSATGGDAGNVIVPPLICPVCILPCGTLLLCTDGERALGEG